MDKEIIKAFQQRLADLGYYSGPIDGIPGNATNNALKEFRNKSDRSPLGPVSVADLHALFDDGARTAKSSPQWIPSVPDVPWMGKAKLLEGTKEVPGAPSNPDILAWAKYLGVSGAYTNDGIAWCGLFVGYVMKRYVPGDTLPKNILGARQWLEFGKKVEPAYGAILVFWRGSPSGWQGHVGFYVGEDDNNYYVLGGNQSDTVNVSKIAKSRLLGARAPKSLPFNGRKVQMKGNQTQSQNEA